MKGELSVDVGAGELEGVTEASRFVFKIKYESRLDLANLTGQMNKNLDDRDRQNLQMLEILICQQLYATSALTLSSHPKRTYAAPVAARASSTSGARRT